MRKRNKGQISVYTCAMLCVFLLLIVTVFQGIRIWEGKAKSRQALAGAVDSIKGDYQPELFRRYHLFALDRTYYGRGEGYLEERAKDYLIYNLDPEKSIYEYQVEDVILTDSHSLTEDNLAAFKQQIQDYMELKIPISTAEVFLNTSEWSELETQDDELQEKWKSIMDGSTDSSAATDLTAITEKCSNITAEDIQALGIGDLLNEQGITDWDNLTMEDLLGMDNLEALVDPRKAIDEITQEGILYVVMPDQAMSVSKEKMDLEDVPSAKLGTNVLSKWTNPFAIQDLQGLNQWNMDEFAYDDSSIHTEMQNVYGILYAMDSFRYAGHSLEEPRSVLEYEVEYLIAGHDSDYENMSEIAERLTIMRFIPNAVYAFSDATMKEEALLFATLLLAPEGLVAMAEPVSYVLLACWAYGESLTDVKVLLQGDKVPIVKDKSTWRLSLNGIQNIELETQEGYGLEQGLDYKTYLMLMLATMSDSEVKYYRMLDVMQLNIQTEISEFKIENCIHEFQLQSEITEGGYVWYMEDGGSYLVE